MHASVQNKEKTSSILQVRMFSPLEVMMDWIGSGSEHRHSSWIGLVLYLAKWTHIHLCHSPRLLNVTGDHVVG